jgi:hypothetical protein
VPLAIFQEWRAGLLFFWRCANYGSVVLGRIFTAAPRVVFISPQLNVVVAALRPRHGFVTPNALRQCLEERDCFRRFGPHGVVRIGFGGSNDAAAIDHEACWHW